MEAMYRVAQFSDTHFSHPGHRSHGGFGYDTDRAWEYVRNDAFGDGHGFDAAVITGDLADHGEPAEYEIALRHLASIPVPANLLPGNHDHDEPLRASTVGSNITMERTQRIGEWLFVFADSNGEHPEGDMRITSNGFLGADELAWIDATVADSDASHVWLWMHHPPAMEGTWAHGPAFDAQVTKLLHRHPRIRGIGAGHVHTDVETTLADRPVILCPAFTVNFDLTAWTTKPPGWRAWEFHDDGAVTSSCNWVEETDSWPVLELPQPVIDYQRGQLSWEELQAYMAELQQIFADADANEVLTMVEPTNDVDTLQTWVGRTESMTEVLDARHAALLRQTLNLDPNVSSGDRLPPLWHFTHFLTAAPTNTLGSDGHPARGGFLPPVALPRRMWAGGRFTFEAPLHYGEEVTRSSTILNVAMKTGSTGSLCFVTVRHDLSVDGQVCVSEEQDLVYRDDPDPDAPVRAPKPAPTTSDVSRTVEPSEVLLFRYSALTFNGHRIHYDRDYATSVEGYPGLVVHGPLTATLLAGLAAEHGALRTFSFRGMAPLFDMNPFLIRAQRTAEGMDLWAETPSGGLAMQAEVTFED